MNMNDRDNAIVYLKDVSDGLKLFCVLNAVSEPYMVVVGNNENIVNGETSLFDVSSAPVEWGRDLSDRDYSCYKNLKPFSVKKRASRNWKDMLSGDDTLGEDINDTEKEIVKEVVLAALNKVNKTALKNPAFDEYGFVCKEGLCEAVIQCSFMAGIVHGGEYDYEYSPAEEDIDIRFKNYFFNDRPEFNVTEFSCTAE